MLLEEDLERLKSILGHMAKHTRDVVSKTAMLFEDIDNALRTSLWSDIDKTAITLEMVRREFVNEILLFIVRRQPLGRELLTAHVLTNVAYDVYRISRYCREIARIDSMLTPESNVSQIPELREVFGYAARAVEIVLKDLVQLKPNGEKEIAEIDGRVDEYYKKIIKDVVTSDKVEKYTALKLLIVRHVERIVDHTAYIENHLKELA